MRILSKNFERRRSSTCRQKRGWFTRYRCISSCDIGHTSPGKGVEREDTEMTYGALKTEMFVVITSAEKLRAYLGSAPFKLRVDNRAPVWLKTYSIDQSYLGRLIVRLDGYHMIKEHRTRDRQQNADSFSKKREFSERLEEKQANQAEIKDVFSFLDKETYDELTNPGTPYQDIPNFPWKQRRLSKCWREVIRSRWMC